MHVIKCQLKLEASLFFVDLMIFFVVRSVHVAACQFICYILIERCVYVLLDLSICLYRRKRLLLDSQILILSVGLVLANLLYIFYMNNNLYTQTTAE